MNRIAICIVALCINTITAAILIQRLPVDYKAAIRQRRNGRGHLVICYVQVDAEFFSLCRTIGCITLRINTITTAILIKGLPAHHKAAATQCGDGWLHLIACHGRIDAEFPSLRRAIRRIKLRINTMTTAILIKGLPAHHKTAAIQCNNGWGQLSIRDCGIDTEFTALRYAACIIALRINTITTAILIQRLPAHYKTAIVQCSDGRSLLRIRFGGVDTEFTTLGHAIDIKTLRINTPTAAVLIIGHPAHHKAATRQRGDSRKHLVVRHIRIDKKFPALCCAVCSIALHIDSPAAAILTQRMPTHHKAVIVQCSNGRGHLIICHARIDTKFPSLCYTVCGITLRINFQIAAIRIERSPACHKAAIVQRSNRWLFLRTRNGCIDAKFSASD